MTTTPANTRPAAEPELPNDPGRHRGPIRRITAASLGTGAALAAVLPMIVFAGGAEPVITGSTLLGFAVGWAMLAVLSTRMTDQPQRWAWVPATALGAVGLDLLILAPDDGVLTAAGWAWPPLLLALAVWMVLRIRRSPAAGSGRWFLYPVVVVMAVAAVGGAVETVDIAADQRADAMPGQLYDVGGYRLHLNCTGSGEPTVVLQSGLGQFSVNWARVVPAVARSTRVCAYDRAGQGWSEDAPSAQDGLQVAADLHTLLNRAGEHGPYVLVGHSIGGDHAMTYAAHYPEQVAGMVLLDTTSPYRAASTGELHAGPPSVVAILPSLSRLSVGRLLPAWLWPSLPEPAAGQYQAFTSSPRGTRDIVAESAGLPTLLTQAQALTDLDGRPLVVLTAAEHAADPEWTAAHSRMAALSTNSIHRTVDASHGSLLEEERGAQLSAQAVEDVIQAVRTGTQLPPQ